MSRPCRMCGRPLTRPAPDGVGPVRRRKNRPAVRPGHTQPALEEITVTDDRTLALMSLMNDIKKPHDAYWRTVRRAAQTLTDSPENDAAQARGTEALHQIDKAVTQWVTEHPSGADKRLAATAQRALESLEDLIANTYDPGVEALGARYELAQALVQLSPRELPLDELGFSRDPQTIREAALHEAARDLVSHCPDHGDSDTCFMTCQCAAADDLRKKARATRGAAEVVDVALPTA